MEHPVNFRKMALLGVCWPFISCKNAKFAKKLKKKKKKKKKLKMANFDQKVPFITGHPVFFKKSADFLGKSPPETVLINQCFGKMKAKKCLKTSVFEK